MKHFVLLLCLIMAATVNAQMPRTLNYQGTLATGSTVVPDGNYNITFRLYTASSGGSAIWSEAQLVPARNGVINVVLGKIVPLPASFSMSYWMSLQIGADAELSPRLELTAVSYSLHSADADSAKKVANGSVTSAALASGAVTSSAIAAGAVASSQILDASVTGTDVASGTLTAGNILDEPGLSSSYTNDFVYPPVGGAITVCDSVDITLPAPGYVYIIANGYAQLYHTNGTPTRVDFYVNTVRASSSGGCMALVPAANSTGPFGFPFMVTKVFSEASAGAKRYYLLSAYSFGSNSSTSIPSATTTALYFPTLRGTASAPPGVPAGEPARSAPDGTLQPAR